MLNNSSFKFLQQLSLNNNKEWFEKNRDQYEKHLLKPCKDLTEKLAFSVLAIDGNIETNPVINKSLTTIHRDLRYSKNKVPFKTRFGINFKKKTSEWKKYPSFFFRIDPNGYYFGMMVMKNDSNKFEMMRKEIDENPKNFQKAIKKLKSRDDLNLWGQDYKKFSYSGKNKSLAEFYCKKNLYISCSKDASYFNSYEEMIVEIQDVFADLADFYELLNVLFTKK